MSTDTVYGDVIPTSIIVPTQAGDQGDGKAGNLFISGGKLYFNPTDGATPEVVTSA